MVEAVHFGDHAIGSFALAPRATEHKNDRLLVATVARELGGALRMATLVEESRWMATTRWVMSRSGSVNVMTSPTFTALGAVGSMRMSEPIGIAGSIEPPMTTAAA